MAGGAPVGLSEVPRATPRERLLLGLILAVGLALRLVDLGDGLWYDEIGTLVRYVRRPLGEIVTRFDTQNQHMLYSILAHVSVRVFGESAWALRLPAALFGVVSLWAVWWLGVRITSRHEALVAAGLLAVSSHHVWFSQDARGYSMLMALSVIGTGLFIPLLDRSGPARGSVAAYALVMAAACWTQVAGGFVLIAHGLVWLWVVSGDWRIPARGAMRPLGALVLAGVVTLLLYAPVLPSMTRTLAGPKATGGAAEWKSLGWFAGEAIRGLRSGVPGGLVTVTLGALILFLGLVSYWRAWKTVTLLLTVPVVVTAAVMLATAHNLWPRLFFFAAGFAALIAVRGGFWICRKILGPVSGERLAVGGAIAAGLASAVFAVPRAWAPKQDFGGAKAYVDEHRGGSDAVVTVDMTRLPYRDFYRTGWIAADSVRDVVAAEQAPRTWVLVTFPDRLAAVDTATWRHLQEHYREVARFGGTVQGGAIQVMQNR